MADREPVQFKLTRPVFFIGFMGAGKSSVARRLARKSGLASVDMDTYIERREGKRISEIFQESGEEGFRRIETEVLRELAESDEPMLISCGGGIVTREENRDIISQYGFAIHLRVDADEAASRISDKSTRPLFNDIDSARARLAERMPAYESVADVTVDTAHRGIYDISMEVKSLLEREGLLCQRQK